MVRTNGMYHAYHAHTIEMARAMRAWGIRPLTTVVCVSCYILILNTDFGNCGIKALYLPAKVYFAAREGMLALTALTTGSTT